MAWRRTILKHPSAVKIRFITTLLSPCGAVAARRMTLRQVRDVVMVSCMTQNGSFAVITRHCMTTSANETIMAIVVETKCAYITKIRPFNI